MDPAKNPSVSVAPAASSNGNGGGGGSGDDGGGFVKWYVHHWTGKLMIAGDYGYKAWPFGGKKK